MHVTLVYIMAYPIITRAATLINKASTNNNAFCAISDY